MRKFDGILKYLNYSKQTIDELWESPDHAIFSYKMNQDGILVIQSHNQTSQQLSGAAADDVGKPLSLVYDKELADACDKFFRKWKDIGKPISYIYESSGESWVSTMQVIGNEMLGIIRKANPNSLPGENRRDFNLFDESRVDGKDTISMVIVPCEDGFQLESYNDALIKSTVKPDLRDKDAQSIFDYFLDAKTEEELGNCIKNNKDIKEIVECEGVKISDRKQYYLVHVIPMIHTDETKLLMRATDITKEYNAQIPQQASKDYAHLFDTNLFGVCAFKVENGESSILEGYNSYFKDLINNNVVALPDIRESEVAKDAVHMVKTANGFFTKTNKDGDKIKYSIYAAPIVIKGSVERVLIFISPVQESVKKYQELKAKLTPREIEILTFVADGFTNRYIAKKLNISEGTVKRTIYNAYKKLEIGSRVELVRIFFNL